MLLFLLVGLAAPLQADDTTATAADGRDHADGASSSTKVKLLDLALVDQNGLTRNFRSDVIGDRVVVLNFIYTTCKTACPMASAIFGLVQERLGVRLGGDVVLVSVSIDPVTDRPARLFATARQFQAKSGWVWLTGDKPTMDQVLRGLGVAPSNVADHPTTVLIGDSRSGEWVRLMGFPTPDDIMTQVERFRLARQPVAGGASGASRSQQGAE